MRKILLSLFILFSFIASAQKIQYVNTYGYEYQRLVADTLLGLPKDTFAVPTALRTIPFLANKSGSLYKWNISTFVWDLFPPGVTYTASQGISLSGNDFQLGRLYGSSGSELTTNREISLDGKSLYFNSKIFPTVSSHVGINILDSMASQNPAALLGTGGNFSRTIRVTGPYYAEYKNGFRSALIYEGADSVPIDTKGGDFGGGVVNELRLQPLATHNSRTVFRGGIADLIPVEAPFGGLSQVVVKGHSGARSYLRGFFTGHTSLFVMDSGQPDTLENFIHYGGRGYAPSPSKVLKSFFIRPTALAGDSVWFLYDSENYKSYLTGSVAIGGTTGTAAASSLLDVSSTTKGVIWPRMTTTQKNAIASPATGLIVFDTDLNQYNFYNGSAWAAIGAGTATWGSITGTLSNQTDLQNALNLKAPLASPTFTGTVTIPTPFTLGATSVTSTGVQLNYLNAATGTTGTTSTNLVFSTSPTIASPTFTGTITTPLTASRAVVTGASSELAASATTATELGYVNGVTSAIQTQLNGKVTGAITSTQIGFGDGSNQLTSSSAFTFVNSKELNITGGGTLLGTSAIFSSLSSVGAVQGSGGFFFGTMLKAATTANNLNKLNFTSNASSWVLARYDRGVSIHTGFSAATGTDFDETTNERLIVNNSGNVGIGVASPTAILHLKAGTTAASSAPLKFSSGSNMTTPESGAVEFDGTNYFGTASTTRYTFAKTLTATATLDFASTGSGAVADLTVTVTGAADGDAVSLGVPNGSVTATATYSAWVSAANTVTVRFSPKATEDPASGTFRVSVIKY